MERVQIKAPDTPEDEKIVFFSQPEAERFLEALENPAYYTASGRLARPLDTTAQRLDDLRANRRSMTQYKFLFYLAIFTGCRRGELVALTWERSGLYERDYQHSEKRLPCKEKNHHKEYQNEKICPHYLTSGDRYLPCTGMEEGTGILQAFDWLPMEKRRIYLYPLEWGNDGA